MICKGASGSKPCINCENVIGRADPIEDGYLVHVSCQDASKFDKQTVGSLEVMVRDLEATHGAVTRAEFAFLEKAYGRVR